MMDCDGHGATIPAPELSTRMFHLASLTQRILLPTHPVSLFSSPMQRRGAAQRVNAEFYGPGES